MNSKLKEKFSKPSETIVDDIDKTKPKTRTKPMRCPVCQDTFFVYEDLAKGKARLEVVPEIEPEHPRDETGFVRARESCGDYNCYMTEEKRSMSLSFFPSMPSSIQQEQVERPKGFTSIKGLFNDIK